MADTDGIAFFERVVADEFLDLSDLLSTVVNVSTEFLADVPEGPPADNFTFNWEEDAPNAQTVTLNGGINNAVTELAVATGHGVRLRKGSILQNTENIAADAAQASGVDRIFVTAVSTDTITTAARGSLSSTAKAHTDGAVFRVINAHSEFSDMPSDKSTDRAEQTQNCQIFMEVVRTSWIRKFSKSRTVPDEEAYQIVQRTIELSEQMDRAFLNSMKGYVTSTDRYYAMGGMLQQIGSGNVVTTSEAISLSVINYLNSLVHEDARQHELPNTLIGPDNIIRAISHFDRQYIIREPGDRERGEFVTRLITDLGNVLTLKADKNMPRGQIALYNKKNLARRNLIPMGLFRMREAKTSDLCLLMTACGLECRNASYLFATHTNLTVPS